MTTAPDAATILRDALTAMQPDVCDVLHGADKTMFENGFYKARGEALEALTLAAERTAIVPTEPLQPVPIDSVALNLDAQLRVVVRERDELRSALAAIQPADVTLSAFFGAPTYDIGMLKEQAEAWTAVVDVLQECAPGWLRHMGKATGIQLATAAIRKLATKPASTAPATGSIEQDHAFQEMMAEWYEAASDDKYTEANKVWKQICAYIDARSPVAAAPAITDKNAKGYRPACCDGGQEGSSCCDYGCAADRELAEMGLPTASTPPAPAQVAQVDALKDKIATAYGIMWHVNAGMDAPPEVSPLTVTPERGAYEARKVLRDLLSHEQRGMGINAARTILAKLAEKGSK